MMKASWYVKVGLTIGGVLGVGYWLAPHRLVETVRSGNIHLFVAAVALVPLFIMLKSAKWHMMARHAGATESFRTSIKAVVVGLGFGIFTPGRAGELMRVQQYDSISKVTLGGLVVVDRVIDLITIVCLSAFYFADKIHPAILVAGLVANVGLLFLLHHLGQARRLIPAGWVGRPLYALVSKLSAGGASLVPANVVRYAGVSFTIWLVVMVQFYYFINMYQPCDFEVVFLSLPIIQFTNLVPITIGGLGVREALSVFVMRPFGIDDAAAAIAAFCIFFFNIAVPGVVGLGLFGFSRRA